MTGRAFVAGAAGGPAGSSGREGSTGRQVAELLLARGIAVRAFVHAEDERADRLRGLGAEVVIGDLREIADVEPAMAGVDRVFFTYPVIDGLLAASAVVASAARGAGVQRLVEVSQLWPDLEAPSARTREHRVSERVFDAAGVGAVHLRATVFYENFAASSAAVRDGIYAMPFGSGTNVVPMIAASDVAKVGAAVLTDLSQPVDDVYRLIGAVRTVEELAADFADDVGAPVRYVAVDEDQWRRGAVQAGLPEHTAQHLSTFGRAMITNATKYGEANAHVTDDVQRATGDAPVSWHDFLAARAN
jgi:uncharacterized protein YbjT (DUF2867 family)